MCLRSPHVTALSFALSHLVDVSFVQQLSQYAWHPWDEEFLPKSFSFCLWILWTTNTVDERPRSSLPFVTVPIISFILRDDSAFSTAIFAFHFRPFITEGWAYFTSGSWESRSIWKSRALPNLQSWTSENVGSFIFVDDLYSATFVK